VREALFAWLGDVEGLRVLDLYAGTGALGIEALSRGAERIVFVERAPRSLAVLRANLEQLELGASARVVRGDVARVIRRLAGEGLRFDLVLADPPYASGDAPRALCALVAAQLLAAGAAVVVERSRRHPLPPIAGLALAEERRHGDTVIGLLRPDPGAGGSGSE
jgi:16S rRNA (guanine966-N2)-methyltransferase